MPSWFVKTKRAQSDTDDEGWAEGAVHPTLNVFDLGDVRTVAIVVDTFPIQNTVIGRSDTAGPQGRGHGDAGGPMFTLDTGGGHAVAIPEKIVRRLTPLECERLQGFPDGWTDEQTDSHRYKQMGNAVTVNVAEWIFNRVSDTIGL